MWVRKISRSWNTKSGEQITKYYYYWYQSKRKGSKVSSECISSATEKEYLEYLETIKS